MVLFVYLKAVFDMVNRKVLGKAIRARGVGEEIVVRVEKMYRETKSRVRVEEKMGDWFWIARW